MYQQTLAQLYHPISDDLAEAERLFRIELKSHIQYVDLLVEKVSKYRGKRLRPAMLLLVAKACDNLNSSHHILAAVMEMIHIATLVHDDVLDDAELRRHSSTMNIEHGNETSVLLGDFLFTHSFHMAAGLSSTHACRLIGQATNRVCEGELFQISKRGDFYLTEQEYFQIVKGKTAELIECCCRLGALYADADEEKVESFAAYGRNVGIAFQIADDLLDMEGSESSTGKSTGTDWSKQKMTLPLIHLREHAPMTVLERLKQWYEQPEKTDRVRLIQILKEYDSFEYARKTANSYIQNALDAIQKYPSNPCLELMRSLTDVIVERTA